MRTRVKFCGISRPEDAVVAARLGADAIGLVFYRDSPRYVSINQAVAITRALPPFVTVVGLFVDATEQEISTVLDGVRIDVLQFHGDEAPDACRRYALPYIKAIRVRSDMDIEPLAAAYADASGLLLDAYQQGVPGGTGKTFDWSMVPRKLHRPIILAGGLTAANVAQAIATVGPYAVDVSGGVESAPGIKDTDRMSAFMKSVNSVKTD